MFESDVESQRLNLHVVAVFFTCCEAAFYLFSPDELPMCLHVFFCLEDGINEEVMYSGSLVVSFESVRGVRVSLGCFLFRFSYAEQVLQHDNFFPLETFRHEQKK